MSLNTAFASALRAMRASRGMTHAKACRGLQP